MFESVCFVQAVCPGSWGAAGWRAWLCPFYCKGEFLMLIISQSLFCSVYFDDVQLGFESCGLTVCERPLQLGLSRVPKWANECGFRLNPQKNSCTFLARKRGLSQGPSGESHGQRIRQNVTHKFSGVILGSKLSFKAHIGCPGNGCVGKGCLGYGCLKTVEHS